MAEGRGAGGPGVLENVEKIKREITCALCLDILEQPRILPCYHVYCKCCLGSIALKSGGGTIPCPECRHVVQLPGNNVANLPTAFHIHRLKEIYFSMDPEKKPTINDQHEETDSATARDETEQKSVPCPKHRSQTLDLYCKTCKKLVCRDCIIFDQFHAEHDYTRVENAATEYKESLISDLEPLQYFQAEISLAIQKSTAVKEEIVTQQERNVEAVTKAFDDLTAVVQEQKTVLLSELHQATKSKMTVISVHEKKLHHVHTQLKGVLSSAYNAADSLSHQDFLSRLEGLQQEIKSLDKKLQSVPLLPPENPDIVAHVPRASEFSDFCEKQCGLYFLDAIQCTASGDGLGVAETDEPSQFQIYVNDPNGNPCAVTQDVRAQLVSVRDGTVTTVNVQPSSPTFYRATYTPRVRGRHDLSVYVSHAQISGSPFQVMVHHPPGKLSAPVNTIDVQRPLGLTVNPDGNLLVASNYSIEVFDGNHHITSFAVNGQPNELTTDHDGNLYISDVVNHQLHKLTKDGECVKTVGGQGKKRGEFNYPNGLAFDSRGMLLVCDSNNNQIQMLDQNLKFIKTIATESRYQFPDNICAGSTGNLYVTTLANSQIHVMNKEVKYMHTLNLVSKPNCMFMKDELIYCSDFNGCLHVLHCTTGETLATFGRKHLVDPQGVVVDEDGYVYVSDFGHNRVVMF